MVSVMLLLVTGGLPRISSAIPPCTLALRTSSRMSCSNRRYHFCLNVLSEAPLLTFLTSRKTPWRLSPTRKANQRKRLQAVDEVITSVMESGETCKALTKVLALPTEQEMPARGELLRSLPTSLSRCACYAYPSFLSCAVRLAGGTIRVSVTLTISGLLDKYTTYSVRHRGFRKSQHKVPKWTRVSSHFVASHR